MIIEWSNAATAAMKRQKHFRAAYTRFRKSLRRITVQQVKPDWFMASASGLVAFATTEETARAKIRAALRRQFLTPLTVQGGKAA